VRYLLQEILLGERSGAVGMYVNIQPLSKIIALKWAEHNAEDVVGFQPGLCLLMNFVHAARCLSPRGNICIEIPFE
jgi:hypothetical protein